MKHILVTGGSRGIGRASAKLAGARGWPVGVNYLSNEAEAAATVEAVCGAGGRAVALQGDMSKEPDVIAVFDEAERTFGPLHGVVVNAGIVAPASNLADMSAERIRRMFEINAISAYLCAREAVRRMTGHGGGSIVLVSSAASRLGSPGEYVDYAGSKGAVDSLTIGLSREVAGSGIRVNAVRPAFIETEIHASAGRPDRAQVLGASTPMGRAGTANEVGEAILWLLSDAASYVTGSFIELSGGR